MMLKKFRYHIVIKTVAALLSFIAIIFTALCIDAAILMYRSSFYARSKNTVKSNLISQLLYDEAVRIADNYVDYLDLNMNDNFFELFEDSNLYYNIVIFTNNDKPKGFSNNDGKYKELYKISLQNYLVGLIKTETIEKNHSSNIGYPIYDDSMIYDENENISDNLTEVYVNIELSVKKELPSNDKYSIANSLIDLGFSVRYAIFFIGFLSAVSTLLLLIFLFSASGHRYRDGKLELNIFNKFPFDSFFLIYLLIIYFCLSTIGNLRYHTDFVLSAFTFFILSTVIYFASLLTVLSFAARVKNSALIKGTLCYKILKKIFNLLEPIGNRLHYIFSNLHCAVKAVIALSVIALFHIFILFIAPSTYDGLFVLFVFDVIAIIPIIIYITIQFSQLKKGSEEIAKGNLEYKINTDMMFGDFEKFGNNLNNINIGIQSVVNEKLKSERMKTELITNVSHDIKTPLTSIINYVDLIKKENAEGGPIGEYIDVLDRQSQRLKKLVEDLIDASKASSGAIKINLEECNAAVLLMQAAGEYKNRFSDAELEQVLNISSNDVKIMADGRYLWRVFDNLMNNICKYALPKTRVYIDLEVIENKVKISFKNISKFPLNINGDELMERFVQGDTSRTTEGSGLGLSIAKSLVDLQDGILNIDIDGDLFKAVLFFEQV